MITGIALLLFWHGFKYLLILFSGLLFGVLLNGLARLVGRHTRLPYGAAFGVVAIGLALVLAGITWR